MLLILMGLVEELKSENLSGEQLAQKIEDDYNNARREFKLSELYKQRMKFGVLLMKIERTCLCCGSHDINEGYVEIKSRTLEWNPAIGGEWEVERAEGIDYKQCNSCERVIYVNHS